MNSALKPVIPQAGVPQSGAQASPAKGNVPGVNHASAHLQTSQNSLNHTSNSLVGQNLTHHTPAVPQLPTHAAPSMAPVSANMAQMAQNMSHHGNLSHVGQNSVPPPVVVASPTKPPTIPLSLVNEKTTPSQPLALTRTPEKKDETPTTQANGTIDSPNSSNSESASPASLKVQNTEFLKDKPDVPRPSPSTPRPSDKPINALSTPQKNDANVEKMDGPSVPSVTVGSEAPEKSPSKPADIKESSSASVPEVQPEPKIPLETNKTENTEKLPLVVPKAASHIEKKETVDSTVKLGEKKDISEVKPEKASLLVEEKKEEPKVEVSDTPKKEEQVQVKPVEKLVEPPKPVTPKTVETKPAPKSTLKLATVTPPVRKRRQTSPLKPADGPSSAKKAEGEQSTPDSKGKRNRTKVQLYQSPTPELTMATKLSASVGRSTPTKPNEDKLIVFYKNEYLAVRNAEGGFYVCQAMQNVYRATRKIKIRWLSQDKTIDPKGHTYKPDFYDITDLECVLTTLSLTRSPAGGGAQVLDPAEEARAKSILERAIKAEQSGDKPNNLELTEEHPDGLDISLFTDESQLEKKSRKRKSSKSSPRTKSLTTRATTSVDSASTPAKVARPSPKKSPKSAHKAKSSPKTEINIKRKSAGSTPSVAVSSKVGIVQRIYRNTATVTEKASPAKAAKTPAKRMPPKQTKVETPLKSAKGKTTKKRGGRESKPSPIVPTPSTSTGKTTRTPRKPPSKK